MALNNSTFEASSTLSDEQRVLYEKLINSGLKDAYQEDPSLSFEEAYNKAQAILEATLDGITDDDLDDNQKTLKRLGQSPSELETVLNALNYVKDRESHDKKAIEDFYNSPEFEALYKEAQAILGKGVRVTSKDVGALLKNGTPKEQALYKLLMSDEYKDLSKTLWKKSDFRRRILETHDEDEIKDIETFFKDLSDVPPEDQNDVKKLIEAFEKANPDYQNKAGSDWYQKQFAEHIKKLKGPELKTLQDFYESDDFKKV